MSFFLSPAHQKPTGRGLVLAAALLALAAPGCRHPQSPHLSPRDRLYRFPEAAADLPEWPACDAGGRP